MDVWRSLSDYPGDADWGDTLTRLSSEYQLRLVFQDWSDTDASGIDWQSHSHDVTRVSNSLLVDVRNGGLKKDLSRILDPDFNTAPFTSTAVLIENAAPHGQLGSFAQFRQPMGRLEGRVGGTSSG